MAVVSFWFRAVRALPGPPLGSQRQYASGPSRSCRGWGLRVLPGPGPRLSHAARSSSRMRTAPGLTRGLPALMLGRQVGLVFVLSVPQAGKGLAHGHTAGPAPTPTPAAVPPPLPSAAARGGPQHAPRPEGAFWVHPRLCPCRVILISLQGSTLKPVLYLKGFGPKSKGFRVARMRVTIVASRSLLGRSRHLFSSY